MYSKPSRIWQQPSSSICSIASSLSPSHHPCASLLIIYILALVAITMTIMIVINTTIIIIIITMTIIIVIIIVIVIIISIISSSSPSPPPSSPPSSSRLPSSGLSTNAADIARHLMPSIGLVSASKSAASALTAGFCSPPCRTTIWSKLAARSSADAEGGNGLRHREKRI